MTATAVRTTTDPRSVPADLRARLDAERQAVTAELEAFDAFVDRIETVPAREPAPAGEVHGLDCGEDCSGLAAVRDAYEATVMSVPHYDEDYGDTYRESVVAEFGPEIGTALTEGRCLQPYLKRVTVGKARSCRRDRERFLELLDVESESVAAVGSELGGFESELQEFDGGAPAAGAYGALEAEWRRLDAIEGEIDRLATDRQRSIIRQRREFSIPSAPDVPTYLYHAFDADYPLLSLCVTLRERVTKYKSERERTFAGR
jgi:hypothetical protein